MNVIDRNGPVKGHWKVDVYNGDPERRPLTSIERNENKAWYEGWPDAPFPLHVGEVVSKPIDSYEGDNLVVTTGKSLMMDRLFGLGSAVALTHMGVGNSATAAAVGNTNLLGATPAPFLKAFDALPTRAGLVVTATTTYLTTDAGSDMNWQEMALFNGAANGTAIMYNRIAPIGPFNKTSAVSLVPSVTITQA